ncbi:serine protease [Bdellovibrio bacteriovorus]|uniref:trypsin-like serine peptidase n=1 Tax=Bdellovibrio bacteriovorus TaxID=959 RepID=UPI0021D33098|nr:serine protease [Bdellovibrio bacteriovorus]UXR63254.1 serine protease [Bdellovibrio bacteriovorus]
MKTVLPLSILFSFFVLGCSQNSNTSAVDASATASVIYHGDSRQEISTQNPSEAAVAKAVAVVFAPNKLKNLAPARYTLKTYKLSEAYPLCPNERFLDQPLLGHCTASLIAPNKVLTAAHCMDSKSSCTEARFIFGWDKDKAASLETSDAEIYKCKSILKAEQTMKGIDYAVVELDRPVAGIVPLKMAKSTDLLSPGTKLLSLSYPLGLPLKKDIGIVLSNDKGRVNFKMEIDTFQGSSGSPLLNAQGEIVGILSRGMDDILEDDIYRIQSEGGCLNFNTCAAGTCFGETFFKVDRIDL